MIGVMIPLTMPVLKVVVVWFVVLLISVMMQVVMRGDDNSVHNALGLMHVYNIAFVDMIF